MMPHSATAHGPTTIVSSALEAARKNREPLTVAVVEIHRARPQHDERHPWTDDEDSARVSFALQKAAGDVGLVEACSPRRFVLVTRGLDLQAAFRLCKSLHHDACTTESAQRGIVASIGLTEIETEDDDASRILRRATCGAVMARRSASRQGAVMLGA